MAGGVSNVAFRWYMVVIAVVVGSLCYFAGYSSGKSKTQYEAAQRGLANQKEIYVNDLLIDKTKPDSRNPALWADRMRDLL